MKSKCHYFVTSIITLSAWLWGGAGCNHARYEYHEASKKWMLVEWRGNGTAKIPSTRQGYPVTRIRSGAFAFNTNVTQVDFGQIEFIGNWAFFRCYGLTDVHFPESISNIGERAFEFSGLTNITFSSEGRSISIGARAFASTELSNIDFQQRVTAIGDLAFAGAANIHALHLPDGLKSIGRLAFSDCRLTSVFIPSGVTSIGEGAFFMFTLEAISVAESNLNYCDLDGVLHDKQRLELIHYPPARKATQYTVSGGVLNIASSAFSGAENLTQIEIPSSVRNIGSGAFSGCANLQSIQIPDGVVQVRQTSFSGCESLREVEIPESIIEIGAHAFSQCGLLKEIRLPLGLKVIGPYAFQHCVSLKEIQIPSQVRRIEWATFQGCTGLTEITIPANIQAVAGWAFNGCVNLRRVYVESAETQIDEYAFIDANPDVEIWFQGEATPRPFKIEWDGQ